MQLKLKKKKKLKKSIKEPRFIEELTLSPGTVIEPREDFNKLSLAYAVHVWVYACVRAIATNFAAVPSIPKIQQSDGSWVENTAHPLYELLKSPNPYMTGYNLREYTAAALELEGNAYWFLERLGGNVVREIWPLIPGQVRAVGTKAKLIDHFVYRVNGGEIKMDYSEVIHYKYMNPNSFIYGQGGMTAAKNVVATDIFAQVWNKSFFQNSARPDAVLSSDHTLNDGVRKRIIESWKRMHGGPNNRGKTAILDAGLKYTPVTQSMKDMDFVELKKEMRTEVLASFGVPPSVIGLLEFANYSNMEQQVKSFWSFTLKPRITSFNEMLTMRAGQITLDFNTVFKPDFSEIEALRVDQQLLATTATSYVNLGIPINAVIDSLKLPFEHVEGGDEPRQAVSPISITSAFEKKLSGEEKSLLIRKVQKEEAEETRQSIRTIEWKVFDVHAKKEEKKFMKAMKRFFKEQRERVLKRMNENIDALFAAKEFNSEQDTFVESLIREWTKRYGEEKAIEDTISLIFDLDAEVEEMVKVARPLIRGTFFDFGLRMAGKIDPNFDFNLTDKFALAWIEKESFQLSLQASTLTKETITKEIVLTVEEAVVSGFTESETIAQIKTRIDGVYKFADRTRAERIARTEVLSASNAGNQDAMEKTGVEKKEWLSSRDDIVRPTHDEMDRQVVGIKDSFLSPSGDLLNFPGDPSASAAERINCRCTTLVVIPD